MTKQDLMVAVLLSPVVFGIIYTGVMINGF